MRYANRHARHDRSVRGSCLTVFVLLSFACACAGSHTTQKKSASISKYAHQKRESQAPVSPRRKHSDPYEIDGRRYYPLSSSKGFIQLGQASWYGHEFHGRPTANGERYDMHGQTAAHKTLPFNTYVKVTNLRNGKQTVVRINDRGPFVEGRIIDLTYTGALALEIVEQGVTPVQIEALGYAREKSHAGKLVRKYVKPPAYNVGDFTIQVGAFAEKDNAIRLLASLTTSYTDATVKISDRGPERLYRVRVGKYSRLEQAEADAKKLQEEGFHNAFAVARDE